MSTNNFVKEVIRWTSNMVSLFIVVEDCIDPAEILDKLIYIYIYIYVCAYVCVCVYVYVCECVCVCVCGVSTYRL